MIGRVLNQRSAGGDQRPADSQRFDKMQSMTVSAARCEHNVYACCGRAPQRRAGAWRQFIVAIDQRAVYVDG